MSEENKVKEENVDYKPTILFILAILFAPGVILGILQHHLMLRQFRQRLIIIGITSLAMILAGVITIISTDAFSKAMGFFTSIGKPHNSFGDLIPLGIGVNLIVAAIIGFSLSVERVKMMKDQPHLTQLKSSGWMYNFQFRRTPFESMKRKKTVESLKNSELTTEDASPLGISEEHKSRDKVICRYMEEANRGTIVTGGVGSGKTITLLSMVLADMMANRSVIYIDFKSDPSNAAVMAKWSKEFHMNFYHFIGGSAKNYRIPNSEGQSPYDPLVSGGSSKADMLLGMRDYDTNAAVYKEAMRQLLQTLINGLTVADRTTAPHIDWDHGEIYKVYSAVESDSSFIALGESVKKHHPEIGIPFMQVAEAIQSSKSTLHQAFGELQGTLRTMIASGYGQWLKTSSESTNNINLFELTKTGGNVVLFSIDADGSPDFSKYFGSLIMADLAQVSAKRRNNTINNQVCVYIDEFQAVDPQVLRPLLEKARSSYLAMTIASQSFEQVIAAAGSNGEAQLNSILDTVANYFIHGGSAQSSAERVSKVIGQERVTRYSQTNMSKTGFFSLNFKNKRNNNVRIEEVEDWKVPPRKMMGLSMPNPSNGWKATAIIVKKSSADPRHDGIVGAVAEECWMIPASKVLERVELPPVVDEDGDFVSENGDHYDDSDFDTAYNDVDAEHVSQVSYDEYYGQMNESDEIIDDDDFTISRIEEGEIINEGIEQIDDTEYQPSKKEPEPLVDSGNFFESPDAAQHIINQRKERVKRELPAKESLISDSRRSTSSSEEKSDSTVAKTEEEILSKEKMDFSALSESPFKSRADSSRHDQSVSSAVDHSAMRSVSTLSSMSFDDDDESDDLPDDD